MKPNLMLMIAGVSFLLVGVSGFFMTGGYDYIAFAGSVAAIALGALFLLVRNTPTSKTLDAILIVGGLACLGMALNALYGQWSGNYMNSPVGYLPGVIWLALAAAFFFVGRTNMSTSAAK